MKLLLLYATSQGQTRRIMRHISDRAADAGHAVELLDATDAHGLEPARFDAAILAGSVHAGGYQKALTETARSHAEALSTRPGLFVSVSLTAAGTNPEEWAELDRIASDFLTTTGWKGPEVAHVAGALRFSEYGFFEYWAMRWIAKSRAEAARPPVTGKEDIEFTDWPALDKLVDGFLTRHTNAEKAP